MIRTRSISFTLFSGIISIEKRWGDGSCMPCQMGSKSSTSASPKICFYQPKTETTICQTNEFVLKEELFAGNLLVVVSLDFCEFDHNFSFASFRSLEVIRLCGVIITNEMLFKHLSNCQLLESVDLVECNMLSFIGVWQLSLKRLAITNCCQVEELDILAPNLQSFHFHGMFPKKYHISGTDSLVDLIITSLIEDCFWILVEASMSLEFVEVLTLCSRALQYVFGSTVAKSGLFRGLRELQLLMVQMTDDNIDDIYGFFGNYDFLHLEKLFIEYSYNAICYKDRPRLRTSIELLRTTQEIKCRLEEVAPMPPKRQSSMDQHHGALG